MTLASTAERKPTPPLHQTVPPVVCAPPVGTAHRVPPPPRHAQSGITASQPGPSPTLTASHVTQDSTVQGVPAPTPPSPVLPGTTAKEGPGRPHSLKHRKGTTRSPVPTNRSLVLAVGTSLHPGHQCVFSAHKVGAVCLWVLLCGCFVVVCVCVFCLFFKFVFVSVLFKENNKTETELIAGILKKEKKKDQSTQKLKTNAYFKGAVLRCTNFYIVL